MRLSNTRIQYYVEGECEQKLVKTLVAHNLILPGQTDVLNPVQDHINNHAGAAPAQIGMKTGRRKITRFLVNYT